MAEDVAAANAVKQEKSEHKQLHEGGEAAVEVGAGEQVEGSELIPEENPTEEGGDAHPAAAEVGEAHAYAPTDDSQNISHNTPAEPDGFSPAELSDGGAIIEEAGAAIPPSTPPEPAARVVDLENVPPPEAEAKVVDLEHVSALAAGSNNTAKTAVLGAVVGAAAGAEASGEDGGSKPAAIETELSQQAERSSRPPAIEAQPSQQAEGSSRPPAIKTELSQQSERSSRPPAVETGPSQQAERSSRPPAIHPPLSPMGSRRATPSGTTPKLPSLSDQTPSNEKRLLGSKLGGPPQSGLPSIGAPITNSRTGKTPGMGRIQYASPGRTRLPPIKNANHDTTSSPMGVRSISSHERGLAVSPGRSRSPGAGDWNLYNKDTVKPKKEVMVSGPTEEERARRRQYRAEQRRRETARRKLVQEREQAEIERRQQEEESRLEARRRAIRERIQKQQDIAAKMAEDKTKSQERTAKDVVKYKRKPLHIRLLEEFEQARQKEEEEKRRAYEEEIGCMKHVRPYQIITGEVVVKPLHPKLPSPTKERPMVFDLHPSKDDGTNVRRSQVYLTEEREGREGGISPSAAAKTTWGNKPVHGPVLYSMGNRAIQQKFTDRAVSPFIFDNEVPINVPNQEEFWPSHKPQVLAVGTSYAPQLNTLAEDDDAPQMDSPTGSAAIGPTAEQSALVMDNEDSRLSGAQIEFGEDEVTGPAGEGAEQAKADGGAAEREGKGQEGEAGPENDAEAPRGVGEKQGDQSKESPEGDGATLAEGAKAAEISQVTDDDAETAQGKAEGERAAPEAVEEGQKLGEGAAPQAPEEGQTKGEDVEEPLEAASEETAEATPQDEEEAVPTGGAEALPIGEEAESTEGAEPLSNGEEAQSTSDTDAAPTENSPTEAVDGGKETTEESQEGAVSHARPAEEANTTVNV